VLQFVSACALDCSSFYFAKGWQIVFRFIVRLLSVVSSFRVAGNGQLIGAGGIIGVRPPSLAPKLNSSTSVEHIAFSPACANEMLGAVLNYGNV